MKFQAQDFIMVPSKQLQACSTESVKMWKHVGPNAYIVDFQTDYKNDSIFNSEDLDIYKGPAVYYQPWILSKSLYQNANKILMLF